MTKQFAPADCVTVDIKKIIHHVLNDDHEQGAAKSKFLKGFGFPVGETYCLKAALEAHAVTNEVVQITPSPWGTKFFVECFIEPPDQRDPCARSFGYGKTIRTIRYSLPPTAYRLPKQPISKLVQG